MLGEADASRRPAGEFASPHLGGLAVVGCVVLGPVFQFMAHPPIGLPYLVLFALYLGFVSGTAVWGVRYPIHWVFAWVGILLSQNAVLAISSRVAGKSPPVWATEMKTAMVYAMAMLLFTQKGGARPHPVWTRWTLRIIGGAMVIGTLVAPSIGAVPYFRNFTLYLCIIYVGSALTERMGWPLMRSTITMAAIATLLLTAAGGLLERIVTTDVWRGWFEIEGLDHLRAVSSWTSLFGFSFRRIGSWNFEPVVTAFMAASAGAVLAMFGWRRHLPLIVLSVVLVVATAGKGALLLMAIVFVVRWGGFHRVFVRRPVLCVVGLWLGTLLLGLVYLVLAQGPVFALGVLRTPGGSRYGGDSVVIHVAGFMEALFGMVTHPLGRGLGSGGNLAALFGTQRLTGNTAGIDTALGALFYQLGILGAVGLVLASRDVAKRARGSAAARKIAVPLFTAWLCGWVFQEEVTGPLSSGLLLLTVGACLGAGTPLGADGRRALSRSKPIPIRVRRWGHF